MKNILLVEPYYETSFLPLGLMKIARFHKNNGNNVKYKRGYSIFDNEILNYNPEEIYITSLFSWDFDTVLQTIITYRNQFKDSKILVGGVCATLFKDKFIEKLSNFNNITISEGVNSDYEEMLPYYDIFPKTDYFIGFTSRGCIRRCGFCMVHKHEPVYFEKSDFLNKLIDWNHAHYKNRIILYDNNFLAANKEHFELVCDKLASLGKRFTIDFNQGLDARLVTKEIVKKLSTINLECLRFAFDNMSEDGFVQNAIKLCRDEGIKCEFRNYVLYNFTDTPEDFYYRLEENAKSLAFSFPMKYQPLDTNKKSNFVGKNWTKKMLNNFKNVNLYPNGIIHCRSSGLYTINNFYEIFGSDAKEFVKRLNNDYEGNNLGDFNESSNIQNTQ